MELPVLSLRAKNWVNFPFVRVIPDHLLWFSWRLAGGRRCIVVKQRDVENVVLLDDIRKV
jgi:hypothetical protein